MIRYPDIIRPSFDPFGECIIILYELFEFAVLILLLLLQNSDKETKSIHYTGGLMTSTKNDITKRSCFAVDH